MADSTEPSTAQGQVDRGGSAHLDAVCTALGGDVIVEGKGSTAQFRPIRLYPLGLFIGTKFHIGELLHQFPNFDAAKTKVRNIDFFQRLVGFE